MSVCEIQCDGSLPFNGDEIVLDGGCGTGRVTEQLLTKLPRGKIIGADASSKMIEQARERFASNPQVSLLVADLTTIELSEQIDAILSTATFHWIKEHDKLFEACA